jgi:hypothetical protein
VRDKKNHAQKQFAAVLREKNSPRDEIHRSLPSTVNIYLSFIADQLRRFMQICSPQLKAGIFGDKNLFKSPWFPFLLVSRLFTSFTWNLIT